MDNSNNARKTLANNFDLDLDLEFSLCHDYCYSYSCCR